MPATPKSLRQPPPRNFDDYSLTYETSPELGLFPIRNEAMQYVPGVVGDSGTIDQYSSELDIGFTFNFNGGSFDRFVVSTCGWCAILQTGTTFSVADYFNTPAFNEPYDIGIDQNALLAPWFSENLQNVYRYASDAASFGDITATEFELFRSGRVTLDEVRQRWIDSTSGGVKIHRGNCHKGRYLLVRWHSKGANTAAFRSTFRFELVVYENGTIEYRYAPIRPLVTSDITTLTAAVGVWIPQASVQYRDFSNYLKPDEPHTPGTERSKYKYGGAVYSAAYSDSISPYPTYSISVNHVDYWPAKGDNGAVFRFAPPINKRRNNRRTITIRDSKPISPAGTFDDRKTTYFVTDTVSYPAGLPVNRPYTTSYRGVHSTLDLFSLGDLELVRTGSGGMYDQVLEETPIDSDEDGFREISLHEQGRFAESFYATGSSIYLGDEPGAFSSGLNMKETIHMSFPVKVSTSMIGMTSSIYYYNRSMARWNIPTGAIGDLTSQFDAFSFDTRWTPDYGTSEQKYTPGSLVSEDVRGFDVYGRPTASGSLDIYRNVSTASFPSTFNQTIPVIGRVFRNNQQMLDAMSERYEKSVTQNVDYTAMDNETFEIPITQPFLLEKAVFEIPLAAGVSWFSDRTTTASMLVSGVYSDGTTEFDRQLYIAADRGGPTLTVALFCKKSGPQGQIDLVMSGTVTHNNDKRSIDVCEIDDLAYSPFPTILFNQVGISDPSTRIVPTLGNTFTGSVVVQSTAAVSNGTTTALWKPLFINQSAPTPPTTLAWNSATVISWTSSSLESKNYSINSSSVGPELLITLGVNSLGRSLQGFSPGGGSAFGADNVTYGSNVSRACSVDNPFYVSDPSLRSGVLSSLNSKMSALFAAHPGGTISFMAMGDVETQGHRQSPYLLNPGDKLILAMSKMRPATHFVRGSVTGSADADTGRGRAEKVLHFGPNCNLVDVVPHDVRLITGSINMSFYGSYVGDGMKRSV